MRRRYPSRRGVPPCAVAIVAFLAWCSVVRADLGKLSTGDPLTQDLGVMIPKGVPELETARGLLKEGKADACYETLRQAAAAHRELPPPRLLLALLLFSSGIHADGAAVLEQAAAETPEHPEVAAALGKLALGERRMAYARLAFEKAASLALPPEWKDDHKRQFQATCHEGLSLVAEARQDWEGARRQLVEYIKLDTDNGAAHHRLARALFWLQQPDQALVELQAGSRLNPLLEPPSVAMARLYAQARNAPKANEWLERAIAEEPKDSRVRLASATWLLEQGRPEEASEQIKIAQSLQSPTPELRRLQGLVARSLRKYTDAEELFQLLLQEAPGDLVTSDQLVLSMIDQDDRSKWARATQLAELNARAYPNDPNALSTLGWVMFRIGRVEEAERWLRIAAGKGPIGSDAAYFLARVLAARGHENDARSLIDSALRTPGTFVNRRDARLWLDAHPAKP